MGFRNFLYSAARDAAVRAATGKSTAQRRRERERREKRRERREAERKARAAVPACIVTAIIVLVGAAVLPGSGNVILALPLAGLFLGIALLIVVIDKLTAKNGDEDASVFEESAQAMAALAPPESPPVPTPSASTEEIDDALAALKRKMRR